MGLLQGNRVNEERGSVGERTATMHNKAKRITVAVNAYVVVCGPSLPKDQSRSRCFREGSILLEQSFNYALKKTGPHYGSSYHTYVVMYVF